MPGSRSSSPLAPNKFQPGYPIPTHQRRCDERYITVAIGRDYQDVAPTSGFYSGEAGSRLESEVSVIVESQGPADRLLPSPVLGGRDTSPDIEAEQQQ